MVFLPFAIKQPAEVYRQGSLCVTKGFGGVLGYTHTHTDMHTCTHTVLTCPLQSLSSAQTGNKGERKNVLWGEKSKL